MIIQSSSICTLTASSSLVCICCIFPPQSPGLSFSLLSLSVSIPTDLAQFLTSFQVCISGSIILSPPAAWISLYYLDRGDMNSFELPTTCSHTTLAFQVLVLTHQGLILTNQLKNFHLDSRQASGSEIATIPFSVILDLWLFYYEFFKIQHCSYSRSSQNQPQMVGKYMLNSFNFVPSLSYFYWRLVSPPLATSKLWTSAVIYPRERNRSTTQWDARNITESVTL